MIFAKIITHLGWKVIVNDEKEESRKTTEAMDPSTFSIAIQTDAASVNMNMSNTIDSADTKRHLSFSESIQHEPDPTQSKYPCLTASFPSLILFTLLIISVLLGRQYVISVLLYIDSLNLWQSMLMFCILFTAVSFPVMWGYVMLNIACGYTYGFIYGTLMTCICATYGMLWSHFIIRKFFKNYVERKYITNKGTRALMEVVSGPNGWKIVFLIRITPLPFGLNNAIFAVSNIRTLPYIVSSVLGFIPTQMVYSYMGSQFRSISQVFSEENSSTWLIITLQVAVTVGLTVFIMKLARRELMKNVPTEEVTTSLTESRGIQTNDCMDSLSGSANSVRSKAHSRNQSVNIPPIITQAGLHMV